MIALLQRVSQASVAVDGEIVGEIAQGLLVLLGVSCEDSEVQCDYLADKTASLRIFEDDRGKMNLSLLDVDGQALVVSNFTLCGDAKKGRRPSFEQAARPETANALYMRFVEKLRQAGVKKVSTGIFGADMKVSLINDGPVTLQLDTQKIMPQKPSEQGKAITDK